MNTASYIRDSCTHYGHLGLISFVLFCKEGGREISSISVTDDYLCYKEPKSPYNFFLTLIFNELFKFKTSDEWQH